MRAKPMHTRGADLGAHEKPAHQLQCNDAREPSFLVHQTYWLAVPIHSSTTGSGIDKVMTGDQRREEEN